METRIVQTINDIRKALHLDEDNLTTVKISTIPNAGNGLFANQELKAGDFIDFYTGEIVYGDLTPEDVDNAYMFHNVKGGFYINARKGGNRTSIINHSVQPNCAYKNYKLPDIDVMVPIVVCIKDVQKDQELLCDYGPKYWKK